MSLDMTLGRKGNVIENVSFPPSFWPLLMILYGMMVTSFVSQGDAVLKI